MDAESDLENRAENSSEPASPQARSASAREAAHRLQSSLLQLAQAAQEDHRRIIAIIGQMNEGMLNLERKIQDHSTKIEQQTGRIRYNRN